MGIGGIGIGPLLLILAIVILLFGTKKLKNLGGDLGGAVKGFKKAMGNDTGDSEPADATTKAKAEELEKTQDTADKPENK